MADFRSDTVTLPTPAMRTAMAAAEVGDDVFGEDPTVTRLQEQAAALFGKQAGLFVPSGTMANLLAVMCQADAGSEVIVEARSHIMNSELAGAARLAGVLLRPLESRSGQLDPGKLAGAIRPPARFWAHTTLVCVENTHNFWGGRVYPLEALREVSELVRAKGLPLHLDGARIFNACEASGVAPEAYGALCDSVAVCLSKGLCAPVGSLLLASQETVDKARRTRKMLGGGMRQVGVLAAAGLVALEQMRTRLADDHRCARRLAEGLAERGLQVDLEAVETNILFVSSGNPDRDAQLVAELASRQVQAIALGELGIRFVTHRGVGDAEVDAALQAVAEIL